MPEEKATLSKQPALEKKPDAAKLPNAPPKTEKPPDKNDGIKPASAAEPQNRRISPAHRRPQKSKKQMRPARTAARTLFRQVM